MSDFVVRRSRLAVLGAGVLCLLIGAGLTAGPASVVHADGTAKAAVAAAAAAAPAAETAAPAAGAETSSYKVRVVDRKRVFDLYERPQKQLKQLEQTKNQRQVDLDKLSEAVLEKKKEYEANESRLTPKEKEAIEEEVQKRYRTYKSQYKQMQDEIDLENAKIIKKAREEIDEAVAAVGREENCHLILEGDPNSASGVLYFSTTIDITSKVIDRLNNAAK